MDSSESTIAVLKSRMAEVKEELAVHRLDWHELDKRATVMEIRLALLEKAREEPPTHKEKDTRLLERITLGLLAALGGLVAVVQSMTK